MKRPLGDYGTANQALNWALDRMPEDEVVVFLKDWREGVLDEYPEFLEFIRWVDD